MTQVRCAVPIGPPDRLEAALCRHVFATIRPRNLFVGPTAQRTTADVPLVCAQVAVAVDGPCAISCSHIAPCNTPCPGPRRLDAHGCPTCDCLADFATEAASCRACPPDGEPVCGSDGVTYTGRCAARCAGAKLLYAAACLPDCRHPPVGCDLDCAWGLAAAPAGAESCLACECAAPPPVGCVVWDAPVCADLPSLGPSTIGSACLALHLGATDGQWGPCGVLCDADSDCPDGARCAVTGFMAGRCLSEQPACNCSAVVAPVCGADGATWTNACELACAEVALAHSGPCCEPRPACPEDARTILDSRGCPAGCTEGLDTTSCAGQRGHFRGLPTGRLTGRAGTCL